MGGVMRRPVPFGFPRAEGAARVFDMDDFKPRLWRHREERGVEGQPFVTRMFIDCLRIEGS